MSGLNIKLADLQISDFHTPECCFLWWHTEKNLQLLGALPPNPYQGLCPWTPLGAYCGPQTPASFSSFFNFPQSHVCLWPFRSSDLRDKGPKYPHCTSARLRRISYCNRAMKHAHTHTHRAANCYDFAYATHTRARARTHTQGCQLLRFRLCYGRYGATLMPVRLPSLIFKKSIFVFFLALRC